jgi:hypothetical protein
MRRFFIVNLSLILLMAIAVGCETTQNLKQSISSKMNSMTSDVDPDLYAQVPENKREGIPEAESDLEIAKNKEALAKLEKERSVNALKIFGYDLDIATKTKKKAETILDLKKMEAIDNAGLGEKNKNIETISDLKSKSIEFDAEIVKIKGKQENVNLVIDELTQKIEEQNNKLNEHGSKQSNISDQDEMR